MSAKSLYQVSTDATLELANLNETLRQIQSEETYCETQAKVTYENASEQAYADLNSCMLGLSQVPTTTEAPSSSAAPSTAAPTTSPSVSPSSSTSTGTVIPATNVPPTTIAPSSSAPGTTVPATSGDTTDNVDVKPEEEELFKFSPRFNYIQA